MLSLGVFKPISFFLCIFLFNFLFLTLSCFWMVFLIFLIPFAVIPQHTTFHLFSCSSSIYLEGTPQDIQTPFQHHSFPPRPYPSLLFPFFFLPLLHIYNIPNLLCLAIKCSSDLVFRGEDMRSS